MILHLGLHKWQIGFWHRIAHWLLGDWGRSPFLPLPDDGREWVWVLSHPKHLLFCSDAPLAGFLLFGVCICAQRSEAFIPLRLVIARRPFELLNLFHRIIQLEDIPKVIWLGFFSSLCHGKNLIPNRMLLVKPNNKIAKWQLCPFINRDAPRGYQRIGWNAD